MLWIIIIGGIYFVIYILALIKDNRDVRSMSEDPNSPEAIIKRLGLQGEKFVSFNGSCVAFLDKKKEEIHVFSLDEIKQSGKFVYNHYSYQFKDILLSEVVIDSEIVTSTERTSQIGGAVVGGVLLGGVGVLAGALSGNTASKERFKSIDIRLTVNDLDNPICKINFLNTFDTISSTNIYKKGHKKESEDYKSAITEVEKWQGMFDVILRNQN